MNNRFTKIEGSPGDRSIFLLLKYYSGNNSLSGTLYIRLFKLSLPEIRATAVRLGVFRANRPVFVKRYEQFWINSRRLVKGSEHL